MAHIEAGLRTGDKYSPFPEEVNRKLVTSFADYFFCPTDQSEKSLLKEGITENVFVTGNTSLDALRITQEVISLKKIEKDLEKKFPQINKKAKKILVTAHRRENHGKPLKNICSAVKTLALSEDVEFFFPVDANPNVKDVVNSSLREVQNIHLLEPMEYLEFTWIMNKIDIILTDSSGVQEEGPFF